MIWVHWRLPTGSTCRTCQHVLPPNAGRFRAKIHPVAVAESLMLHGGVGIYEPCFLQSDGAHAAVLNAKGDPCFMKQNPGFATWMWFRKERTQETAAYLDNQNIPETVLGEQNGLVGRMDLRLSASKCYSQVAAKALGKPPTRESVSA